MDQTIASLEMKIRDLGRRNRALYRALTRREESLSTLLPKFYRHDEIPTLNGRDEEPVDIVLSAYNAFDFLEPCLESIFANTDVPFHLFLNDDASTDTRIPELLRKVHAAHPERVTLFFQEKNLGFPDAMNRLLAETTRDVILVNSDTAMPSGWASRLLWPIRHFGKKVASCTPFSNSGMYTAFPAMFEDAELFEGMRLDELDRIFQSVKPESALAMPVGLGFCMAMSRAALNETGLFDAETFRPGYGEETDWCCRAATRGYENVLVPNLFVYHRLGATFKKRFSGERERIRERHVAVIKQRYPHYESAAHDFADSPTYRSLHSFLLFLASVKAGGGLEVIFSAADPGALAPPVEGLSTPALVVRQHRDTGEYFFTFRYKRYMAEFTSPNLNWTIKLLYRVQVNAIRIEGLASTADKAKVLRALGRLAGSRGVRITGGCE